MVISKLLSLCRQRFVVYLLGVFLSLVLFNTTYLELGTYVPLSTILLTILCVISSNRRLDFNKDLFYYVIYVLIVFFATFLSGGDNYRDIIKIFLVILFYIFATSIPYTNSEIRFLSLIIVVSYLIYAILVIRSIGADSYYYGRVSISILNSDIPLDPNVTASVFPLPIMICMYNLLYGRMKIFSICGIIVFLVAIVVCGSRGAFLGLLGVFFILYDSISNNKVGFASKWLFLIVITIVFSFSLYYIIDNLLSDDSVLGMQRILDVESDDVSSGRIEIWAKRLDMIFSSPIIGYGTNYDVGNLHFRCHNTFLQILYFGGFVGFIIFFIPLVRSFKKKTVLFPVKCALFISVFAPIFFIDTLQERTMWNFLIFYELLSRVGMGEDCLIWIKKKPQKVVTSNL